MVKEVAMIGQLIWKEFREHVWKMLSLLGILLSIVVWTESSWAPRMLHGTWEGIWITATWFAPVWLAAFTITGERTGHTELILAELPVKSVTVFGMKTFWGSASIALPLAISLWAGAKSLSTRSLQMDMTLILSALTLYQLILCVGMRVSHEGMAAMFGILVLLACAVGSAIATDQSLSWPSGIVEWLLLIPNPFFLWTNISSSRFGEVCSPVSVLIVQLMVTVAYWLIGARYYGRQSLKVAPENPGAALKNRKTESLFNFPIPGGALFWKERREQQVILVVTAIVGIAIAVLFGCLQHRNAGYFPHGGWTAAHDTVAMLFIMGSCLPTAVGTILGIAAMTGDSEESMGYFWRSRPIATSRLFWAKYLFALLGIAALVAFFEMTFFVGMCIIQKVYFSTGSMLLNVNPKDVVIGQVFWLPLVLSLAFCWAAVFRRTVYATAMVIVTIAVVSLCPLSHDQYLGNVLFGAQSRALYPLAVTLCLLLTGVFLALARVAFGRGWRVG